MARANRTRVTRSRAGAIVVRCANGDARAIELKETLVPEKSLAASPSMSWPSCTHEVEDCHSYTRMPQTSWHRVVCPMAPQHRAQGTPNHEWSPAASPSMSWPKHPRGGRLPLVHTHMTRFEPAPSLCAPATRVPSELKETLVPESVAASPSMSWPSCTTRWKTATRTRT